MSAPAFDHALARPSVRMPRVAPTLGSLSVWAARARTRAQLRDVIGGAPERLADIGVDAAQARAEAAKPFWIA